MEIVMLEVGPITWQLACVCMHAGCSVTGNAGMQLRHHVAASRHHPPRMQVQTRLLLGGENGLQPRLGKTSTGTLACLPSWMVIGQRWVHSLTAFKHSCVVQGMLLTLAVHGLCC